jgi:hypothetical protein
MVRLWEFSQRLQQKYWKGKPPREVASRVLNFMISRQHVDEIEWASAAERKRFETAFATDESCLFRLSVTSPRVDELARRFRVHAESLEDYLIHGSNFDINQTYNPDRKARMNWIESVPLPEHELTR